MSKERMRRDFRQQSGKPLFEAVHSFLEEEGLDYERCENGFYLPSEPTGGSMDCMIECSRDPLLHITAEYCQTPPKPRWNSVLQCINALNHQLGLGHFTLDPANGKVSFRINAWIASEDSGPAWIKQHFDFCLRSAAIAQPGLMPLFFEQLPAQEAAARILTNLLEPPPSKGSSRDFGWN